MGLIRMSATALSSTARDQIKDYFRAENLSNDVLCTPAVRVNRSLANSGNMDVITDGSVFDVAIGQCALLIENGKVHDLVVGDSEKSTGQYRYDSALEPSVLTGGLKEQPAVWDTIKERFAFGGQSKNTMRLVYINMKEITQNPVGVGKLPFFDTYLQTRLMLGAHGYYSFKISNPVAFYENLVMDPARKYRKDDIIPQLKAEMMPKIQAAITKVAPLCVNGYQDLYIHDKDIALSLNKELKEDWVEGRGIELVKVALTPELSPQDTQRVMDLENARTLSNANMAMGSMVNAQNEAMKTAAGNANGAVNGFMGVNMAGSMAGVKPSDLQTAANTQAGNAESWVCPTCHKSVQGKFCSECGTPKPQNQAKFCSQCGTKLDASSKFCPNCGTKVQ